MKRDFTYLEEDVADIVKEFSSGERTYKKHPSKLRGGIEPALFEKNSNNF